MEFQENILGLIGNTPLVKLNRLARGVKAQIFAKMESLNPAGRSLRHAGNSGLVYEVLAVCSCS